MWSVSRASLDLNHVCFFSDTRRDSRGSMLRCECLGDPSSSSSLSPPISSTDLHLLHRSGELQPAFAGLTHGLRSGLLVRRVRPSSSTMSFTCRGSGDTATLDELSRPSKRDVVCMRSSRVFTSQQPSVSMNVLERGSAWMCARRTSTTAIA